MGARPPVRVSVFFGFPDVFVGGRPDVAVSILHEDDAGMPKCILVGYKCNVYWTPVKMLKRH